MSGWNFRNETLDLDENAREDAPGKFIRLLQGFTHYELSGPHQAQTVVLVHGFSVPYYIWDPTIPALLAAGFRVLRYDLFGRGYSDRPQVCYNLELFESQLLQLLDGLHLSHPVDIAGLSMGGALTCAFSAQYPGRVRKVALLGPAGLPMSQPFSARLLKIPRIGEWLFDRIGEDRLISGQRQDFNTPENYPEYFEKYRIQMRYRGFKQAMLSSIRSGVLDGAAEDFFTLGKLNIPVLLIWGEEDQTVPFQLNQRVREAIQQVEFHPIKDCRHLPHYEHPEVVNPLLIRFFT
jgi:pimeloyl-ACP methyl ester carboxylesterase